MAFPFAQHRGMTGQHGANRIQRFFCFTFLNKTDDGVNHDHPKDHTGIDVVF